MPAGRHQQQHMACVGTSYVEHRVRRPCTAVMGLLCVLPVCPSCFRTCFWKGVYTCSHCIGARSLHVRSTRNSSTTTCLCRVLQTSRCFSPGLAMSSLRVLCVQNLLEPNNATSASLCFHPLEHPCHGLHNNHVGCAVSS